jgi:hypothetical protein
VPLALSLDINQWATAIKICQGVVGGLEGTDAGWANLANPLSPPPNGAQWGHCLYFFAYHMHDGQKCVIAKSGWGNAGNTTVHHIEEKYFQSGFMFNAYTLVLRGNMQNQTELVLGKDGKTIWKATQSPRHCRHGQTGQRRRNRRSKPNPAGRKPLIIPNADSFAFVGIQTMKLGAKFGF